MCTCGGLSVVLLVAAGLSSPALAEDTFTIAVINAGAVHRSVEIRYVVCGGEVRFRVRIGCTKNKTHIKEGIADGAKVSFLTGLRNT